MIGLSPLREKQEDLMYSNTMGLLIKSIISFRIINTINKRIKSEREHHQISYHMLFFFLPQLPSAVGVKPVGGDQS